MKYIDFEVFMLKNNIKRSDLSRLLNISKSSVCRRLKHDNNVYFKAPEVKTICEFYKLDANIFFLNI